MGVQLLPASAFGLTSQILSDYNSQFAIGVGEHLPEPLKIEVINTLVISRLRNRIMQGFQGQSMGNTLLGVIVNQTLQKYQM